MSDLDLDDEIPAADRKVGKNDNSSDEQYQLTAGEMRQFAERFQSLESDMKALREDKKELLAELKGRGFDTKAFQHALKIAKLDEDKSKMQALTETKEIAEIYLIALGKDHLSEFL